MFKKFFRVLVKFTIYTSLIFSAVASLNLNSICVKTSLGHRCVGGVLPFSTVTINLSERYKIKLLILDYVEILTR